MKKPITFRISQDLIDQARLSARAENRTLTNFVETILKMEVERRKRTTPMSAGSAGKVGDSSVD